MSKLYECFHSGARAVIWDADFDAEDYGFERPGIVHDCHCTNCGAMIQYILLEEGDDNDE